MKIAPPANVRLMPSLIGFDMCRLLDDVRAHADAGFDTLHIDIIDGHFSPSMPLGLHAVQQLRKACDAKFDVHLMTENDDYFLDEILDIGAQSVCFHWESARHPQHYVNRMRKRGASPGIAIKPATPVETLRYAIEDCDFALLMLINPGYANTPGESQISYAAQKVADMKRLIDAVNPRCEILLDGRVSCQNIVDFSRLGATRFAIGSTCFRADKSMDENITAMNEYFAKHAEHAYET